jgi:hypothetical protein
VCKQGHNQRASSRAGDYGDSRHAGGKAAALASVISSALHEAQVRNNHSVKICVYVCSASCLAAGIVASDFSEVVCLTMIEGCAALHIGVYRRQKLTWMMTRMGEITTGTKTLTKPFKEGSRCCRA